MRRLHGRGKIFASALIMRNMLQRGVYRPPRSRCGFQCRVRPSMVPTIQSSVQSCRTNWTTRRNWLSLSAGECAMRPRVANEIGVWLLRWQRCKRQRLQNRTSQVTLGKSFDTHAPFGPWITTADSIDVSDLAISCLVTARSGRTLGLDT